LGISGLPDMDGDRPAKKKFKRYPIGYVHIDVADVRSEEGKLYLVVAVDRTSKFAFARLVDRDEKVKFVTWPLTSLRPEVESFALVEAGAGSAQSQTALADRLAPRELEIEIAGAQGDRARAELPVVDLGHRHDLAVVAGAEDLVGGE
jgi:hypothetical protein